MCGEAVPTHGSLPSSSCEIAHRSMAPDHTGAILFFALTISRFCFKRDGDAACGMPQRDLPPDGVALRSHTEGMHKKTGAVGH
jgi:hypothetical protein